MISRKSVSTARDLRLASTSRWRADAQRMLCMAVLWQIASTWSTFEILFAVRRVTLPVVPEIIEVGVIRHR